MLSAPPPADPGLRVAYEEALAGYLEGGLPIGAALFHQGKLIGRGRNRRVQDGRLCPQAGSGKSPVRSQPFGTTTLAQASLGRQLIERAAQALVALVGDVSRY